MKRGTGRREQISGREKEREIKFERKRKTERERKGFFLSAVIFISLQG